MLRLFPVNAARPAAAAALACAGLCSVAGVAAQAATSSTSAATMQPASATSASAASKKSAKAVAKANAAQRQALAPTTVPATASAPAPTPAADTASDFSTFVDRYGPAVVHVSARAADDQTAPPEQEAIDADDPFSAFFRRAQHVSPNARPNTFPNGLPNAQTGAPIQAGAPRVMTGAGSGFIVSPDGLVLTTAHVVDNAGDVTVRLTDRREFKAEVVAVDTQSDVAVLQIDAHDLPFVKLGDSSKVRVGEPVLTIGSPDSFQNTVTTGIVSATSRTLADGRAFPFFQTDVAVNPDNSGGPLFNRAGEVIGIAVQVYADGERYASLTFAIPIDAASAFRAQLAQAGRGTTAKANPNASANAEASDGDGADGAAPAKARTTSTFGMHVEDVSPGIAAALGLTHASGALVDSVTPGSAAASSGLRAGDVIVKVGNTAVVESGALAAQLAALPPATPTSLRLIRGRRVMTASFANAAADANSDTADTDTDAAADLNSNASTNSGGNGASGTGAKLAGGATLTDSVAANPVTRPGADNGAGAGPGANIVPVAMPVARAAPIADTAVAARSAGGNAARAGANAGGSGRAVADRLGLTTHALSEAERRSTGLPLGLMVDAASGPAAHAGIQAGDVVLSLDDTLVETQQQAATLEAVASKSVAVLIQRDNARSFVSVKLR
ncbi:S1-C subfamily serine protease [Paraburkholderia tropica]|uniref:Probable periplasmic serine endoprotease DegP-like n=2 Tax=Paraburkholderia tropica TaxID=92647 RepID=A0ABX5MKE0_9BURK|nr:S1-C subfamily serine protease [Paraburkholderia tropica]PZW77241.1 S1-C subfamily serine protease [Paraburkholderia tropica]